MAIIAGLNMSPISRLKKTVSDEILKIISSSENENFFSSGQKFNLRNFQFSNTKWTRRVTLAVIDRH